MPRKIICEMSKDELYQLYITEKRTLLEMCEIVGIKSPITMSKILKEKGISTNKNAIVSNTTKNGMNDEEFKKFLIEEYKTKGISQIAKELNVSQAAIRKYFKKSNIEFINRRKEFCSGENSPTWNGGRHIHNGYIEIYAPDHPHKNKRNCIYEHQLVMEKHIGRYLEKGEVVHHIDFDKTNNDISNLMLMTNSEHVKYHSKLRWEKERM